MSVLFYDLLGIHTVKVKDSNWLAVDLIQRPQCRKGETVITTERNKLGFSVAQRTNRAAIAQSLESLSHLFPCNIVVKRRDGNITTVNNLGPVLIRVHIGAGVECAQRSLAR